MTSFSIFGRFWIFLTMFVLECVGGPRATHYMSTGEDPAVFVKEKIKKNEAMVFARSYGTHNNEAKELLKKLQSSVDVQIEFLDVDLLTGFDSSLVLVELEQLTGQWAFPNIFIGQKHIGGNNELDQLHAIGKLESLLREAGNEL